MQFLHHNTHPALSPPLWGGEQLAAHPLMRPHTTLLLLPLFWGLSWLLFWAVALYWGGPGEPLVALALYLAWSLLTHLTTALVRVCMCVCVCVCVCVCLCVCVCGA